MINNNEPRVLLCCQLPVTLSRRSKPQLLASSASCQSKESGGGYSLRACTCLSGFLPAAFLGLTVIPSHSRHLLPCCSSICLGLMVTAAFCPLIGASAGAGVGAGAATPPPPPLTKDFTQIRVIHYS
jgi:hypothetical protein